MSTANLAFPALSKDGSLLFAGAGGMGNGGGSTGYELALRDAAGHAGHRHRARHPSSRRALPVFSPDGPHVSFNFWSGTLTRRAARRSPATRRRSASSTSTAPARSPTRASCTRPRRARRSPGRRSCPRRRASSSRSSSSRTKTDWGYTWQRHAAELWWVDVASKTAHRLDRLNGYLIDGARLPARQRRLGHAPAPARRDAQLRADRQPDRLGRLRLGRVHQPPPLRQRRHARSVPSAIRATTTGSTSASRARSCGSRPSISTRRRAPIPSHPAFYLPAQELLAGNARGFWTVDPCHADGTSCEHRRRVLRRLLSAGRRRAHLHVDAADLLGRVREVHHRRRLLRRGRGHRLHQQHLLAVAAADSVAPILRAGAAQQQPQRRKPQDQSL